MKTNLFVKNGKVRVRLRLKNAMPAKVTAREPEVAAGCNCDRWGHPCPGCVHQVVEPETHVSVGDLK